MAFPLPDTTCPFDLPNVCRAGALAARYGSPPVSVLDSRQGYWTARKRAWMDMDIPGPLPAVDDGPGRGTNASITAGTSDAVRKAVESCGGTGPSVFDPVVADLAYRWFCPPGGDVLDPFAGGPVRGLVAAHLGYQYIGIDIRTDQVIANRITSARAGTNNPRPLWFSGDSRGLLGNAASIDVQGVDMLFSCPPYGDLERYSDHPADISNMKYSDMLVAYRDIVTAAADLLLPGRFAVWVVGNFRAPDGSYHDFVGDTIRAFCDAGLHFWNDAILITPAGTLPLRAARVFNGSRKLLHQHQVLLVFLKGSLDAAKQAWRTSPTPPRAQCQTR